MAREFSGQLRLKAPLKPTALQQKLLTLLNDKEAMREAHKILGERCNKFVPEKSGELKAHMRPYPQTVRWERPYAHYQYEGKVYGPNYPGWISANQAGWRSGKKPKYPTGRELGVPGIALLQPRFGFEFNTSPILVKFGYTTPNTGHHWFDKAMENGGLRAYSIAVTNMLKRRAKALNK